MLTVAPIHEVFPAIRRGLLHILSTCPTADWTLESLVRTCAEGHAQVLVDDTRGESGFIIYFLRGTDLVLWVVYSDRPRAQQTYLDEVLAFARFHGCTRLVMDSPRRGFLRDPQWRPISVRYAMDTSNNE